MPIYISLGEKQQHLLQHNKHLTLYDREGRPSRREGTSQDATHQQYFFIMNTINRCSLPLHTLNTIVLLIVQHHLFVFTFGRSGDHNFLYSYLFTRASMPACKA